MSSTLTSESLVEIRRSGGLVQVVDVRSPGEFASGHIPGAVNIPVEQVEARLADLAEAGDVVLVCQSGDRACIAENLLSPHRKNLRVLVDGTTGWLRDGHDVVQTTSSRWSLERQVRLVAGLIVLASCVMVALGMSGWIYVAMFIGAGLTFAGLTNICGMASLFALMPWNKPATKPKLSEAISK